jgi:endonuclease YncB( thermonuclease family)
VKRACPEPSSTELGELRVGIDAPESEQTGKPAKAKPTCQVNARDLGDVMVRRGMAIAYLRYLSKYMEAEVEARRGVWQGEFVDPEEWWHRQ